MADFKSLMKLKVVELKERLQALGKTPKGRKRVINYKTITN